MTTVNHRDTETQRTHRGLTWIRKPNRISVRAQCLCGPVVNVRHPAALRHNPGVKARNVFVCQECGSQYPKWRGRCTDCGAWNSMVEERVGDPATAPAGGNRYGALVPG